MGLSSRQSHHLIYTIIYKTTIITLIYYKVNNIRESKQIIFLYPSFINRFLIYSMKSDEFPLQRMVLTPVLKGFL